MQRKPSRLHRMQACVAACGQSANTAIRNGDSEEAQALNLDIFIAVWKKVVEDATFMDFDWTVKAAGKCTRCCGAYHFLCAVICS